MHFVQWCAAHRKVLLATSVPSRTVLRHTGFALFLTPLVFRILLRIWQIDTWTIGVRTEKKTAYHLLIAALFSGLHTDFYRLNKIASLQTIQYGVSIDFLLLDFTKESMHWKLIPSYIQNSNLSYRMKGTLNKPSFRRLFFSIQIPSLKSTYSVLEAIVNEDFLHRLHIYRYPFCKGSSAFPHRFCLGVLKYIECSWEASGSVPSFLSCSYRKAGHSGEFGQNL